jgi:TolB protein
MKIKTIISLILFVIIVCFISLYSFGTGSSAKPNDLGNTRIVYVVYEKEGPAIFTMKPDGSNKARLTGGDAPCWSPDGKKIAFSAKKNGNIDVYYMNADGSDITRLTTNPAYDGGPSWSPDGSMIAFESERSGSSQVWKTNVEKGNWGYNLTQLTRDTPHKRVNNFLSWSPNGLWIAFEADRDRDDPEIYLANAVDGTNQQRLTFTRALDEVPSWFPDSKQIVFSSDMHGKPQSGNYDIYIINVDGSDVRRITTTAGAASNPCVSADGSKIVYDYHSDDYRKSEIYIMNADGSNPVCLGKGSNPAWSPFLKTSTK